MIWTPGWTSLSSESHISLTRLTKKSDSSKSNQSVQLHLAADIYVFGCSHWCIKSSGPCKRHSKLPSYLHINHCIDFRIFFLSTLKTQHLCLSSLKCGYCCCFANEKSFLIPLYDEKMVSLLCCRCVCLHVGSHKARKNFFLRQWNMTTRRKRKLNLPRESRSAGLQD